MRKIALITGASSGIGEACAENFAAANYDLILVARRADKLSHISDSLKQKYGIEVKQIVLDVSDKKAVKKLFNELSSDWKKVDVLVNNAGLSAGLEPINEGDTDDWDRMIDTNVKGLLYVTKEVSNWMVDCQSGHIINIGSIAAKEVYANGNVYCATKHAVDALNKSMRIDLLPHNIKVSAVHPGMVETEFSIVRFKGDEKRAQQVYQGFDNLIAKDIADAISYIVNCPKHVNISDMVIMPTAQASATIVKRIIN
ncbi:MAG: SDR family NAD(P)-dependent oxidoreductase [Sphingobacteriaceae bacterium]|nr:SDR family NAD(P)-dependent oxidoreductase [Sphingobacteriaceae bacterium]